MSRFYILFSVIMLALSVNAQEFQVKVVKISDGDTFEAINSDNLQLRFRIYGIDAPEKKQAFYTKSKQHLSELIFGKNITVDVQGRDGWGRYIAYVSTAECADVSLEMLKTGMAWHYTEYDDSLIYGEAEKLAKKNKRGLWTDNNQIAPWDYRKNKKKKESLYEQMK